MARKKRSGLTRRSLFLWDEDIETLTRFFPGRPWSEISREVLHKFCLSLETRVQQETTDDDLELNP